MALIHIINALLLVKVINCFYINSIRIKNTSLKLSNDVKEVEKEEEQSARDLSGYKLWLTFTGFDVKDMNTGVTLNKSYRSEFVQGLSSREPGFWRVVRYDDGKENIEITHAVPADYMYFFDLWEPSILWRGTLDFDNKIISDGECIVNKKRFGLFPYQENLASWSAKLLEPSETMPTQPLPEFNQQTWVQPDLFFTPGDMKKFPNIFNQDYVDYMFEVEDATVRGDELPARPAPLFVPSDINTNNGGNSGGVSDNAGFASKANDNNSNKKNSNKRNFDNNDNDNPDNQGGKLRKRKR